MEVKGEYGRASSTVGGGLLNGSPPPFALCQSPFIAACGVAHLYVSTGAVEVRWWSLTGVDGLGHMARSSYVCACYAAIADPFLPDRLPAANLL
jgi:hypothetical protein